MINSSIFKKYDIRGKYPDEVNRKVAEKIAQIYFEHYKPKKVVIGYDSIEGSNEISDSISKSLQALGTDVDQIGMSSTPMLYWACSYLNAKYGIMITASHLGEGHTGIKIIVDGVPPEEEVITKFRNRFSENVATERAKKPGKITTLDIRPEYIKKIQSFAESNLTKYKVAIDSSNGPNGPIIDNLFGSLGIPYSVINRQILGKNLSHPTNPKILENRQQLIDSIIAEKADLGIIWDEDCDRAYFLDSKGEVIPPEFIAIQIAQELSSTSDNPTITADVRASAAVEKELTPKNITVKRIKAWHVPIKLEMNDHEEIYFGFEVSGHFVFRDFNKIDDALLADILFLKAINKNPITLKEKLEEFKSKYYIREEINYKVETTEQEIVEQLKEVFKDGKISLIDGITVDYKDWRFNIRASKTEPIIRLNISGTSKEKVEENLKKIEKIVNK